MDRKKFKLSILIISLLIIILSGCGNQNTANKVVESLEQKDYFTAGKIYDEAVRDLSDEEKENVDEVVSKAIIELIENRYKQVESDNSVEASFYNLLDKIDEMDINNEDLNKNIESYEQTRETKVEDEVLNQEKEKAKLELLENDDASENTSNEITITQEEKDGIHFWKGNRELVTGNDWISLTEEEKKRLVLIEKEHLDTTLNITLEKSTEEYVQLLNSYFSDESSQNEKLKDIFTNYMLEDIQN